MAMGEYACGVIRLRRHAPRVSLPLAILLSMAMSLLPSGDVSGASKPRLPLSFLQSAETEAWFCPPVTPQVMPLGAPWRRLNQADMTQLKWSTWSPNIASGTGTVNVDDCVPGCVGGRWISYPVKIVLSGRGIIDGQKLFSLMTVEFMSSVPFGKETETIHLIS
jgi:hypothetical protein